MDPTEDSRDRRPLQLVIEAGDANYVTITQLVDRGVDVNLEEPDVDAYKVGRGVAPS